MMLDVVPPVLDKLLKLDASELDDQSGFCCAVRSLINGRDGSGDGLSLVFEDHSVG